MRVLISSKNFVWNISRSDQPRGLVVRVSDYSRFRFPVLPWEFFLAGKDSRGDHGLGS